MAPENEGGAIEELTRQIEELSREIKKKWDDAAWWKKLALIAIIIATVLVLVIAIAEIAAILAGAALVTGASVKIAGLIAAISALISLLANTIGDYAEVMIEKLKEERAKLQRRLDKAQGK